MYTCLHVTNFYLASDKFKCNLYLNVTNFYLASDKIRIESDVESILNQAFSESTASTFDRSLMKEKAPYTIRNALGLPLMVQHSANLRVVGSPTLGKLQEVAAGQSVDLDQFFTTRRLLNQVRQLDRLSVPSTELNAWLVHRDQETVVSAASQSSPSITLDNGAGLEDLSSPDVTPAMRGGGGAPESTYNPIAADSSLGAVAPEHSQEQGTRDGNDDLTKEVQPRHTFYLNTREEEASCKAASSDGSLGGGMNHC
jgi:hypothetical protein